MARLMDAGPAGPELARLVAEACAAFDALPPAEQRAHRQAQRRSWAIGELMLAYPNMTREDAERRIDDALAEVGP